MAAWGLLLSGSLSVAASGYLLAEGNARDTLWVVVGHTIIGLLVTAALLPVLGINALGVSSIAMAASDAVLFNRALRRHIHDLHPVRALVVPMTVSTLGAAAGWLVTIDGGANLLTAAAGAAVALAIVLAGHWLTDRATLRTIAATVRRAARSTAG
jgi:O-antigen/teichoic acid export membrane protein